MVVAGSGRVRITRHSSQEGSAQTPTLMSLVAEVFQHFYFLPQFSGFDVPVSEHQSVRISDN